MSTLTVETFILGPDETNCYLLSAGGEAVVIDAGVDPARLAARIKEQGFALRGVYLTHFHIDHAGGAGELRQLFGAPVFASPHDDFLKDISLEAGGVRELAEFLDFPVEPLGPGRRTVLGQPMVVLDTPGHTPGSLSFFFPAAGCVFVGDLLFMIAVGRTDLPRGSGPELIGSIRSRIFILPGDTRVYPGHGPMTTVIHEKENNPHFIFQSGSGGPVN
ncbi:MAG: MBL fold metallo-hydrolase [Pseudomonadota bacterium]